MQIILPAWNSYSIALTKAGRINEIVNNNEHELKSLLTSKSSSYASRLRTMRNFQLPEIISFFQLHTVLEKEAGNWPRHLIRELKLIKKSMGKSDN